MCVVQYIGNRKTAWGYGSVGRAMRSQCIGQGFESPYLHHIQDLAYVPSLFLHCSRIATLANTRFARQIRWGASLRSLHAMHRSGVRIPLSPPRQRLGLSCTRKGLTSTVKPFSYAALGSRRLIVTISDVRNNVTLRFTTLTAEGHGRTNPLISTIKTHAKGAYKAPPHVSFSM